MEYEIIEDKLSCGDYRVEAINKDGDGEVFIAIFVGPSAQTRAEEYAKWKNFTALNLSLLSKVS
jgi:hypothetical protein